MAEVYTGDAESTTWRLDKYARYIVLEKESSTGHWKYFNSSAEERLVLTLTGTKHLLVLQGSVVLESHSLVTARAWMRGLCKNDSLLVMYKHGKGTRRFRVKFMNTESKTANQVCCDAAVVLSSLFSIHVTAAKPAHVHQQVGQTSSQVAGDDTTIAAENLEEITLGTMAQIVLGESQLRLPEAYRAPTPDEVTAQSLMSDDVVVDHLRLLLADPTFPAFVERIDRKLREVMKECQD